MKIESVIVSVSFCARNKTLAQAEVEIHVPESGYLDTANLIDACQRSVGHCLEELEKQLDN